MYNCHQDLISFFKEDVRLRPAERNDLRAKRDRIRAALKRELARNDLPRPLGFHIQGSFAMGTMVRFDESYDLDDGVYFDAADLVGARGAAMAPLAVRHMVCNMLQRGNWDDPPEVLKNCVRVWYAKGFHVDLPIYRRRRRRKTEHGIIRIWDEFELAGSSWKRSAAREVTKWFVDTNRARSPDGEQFRRVVCYLKAIARSRPSWKSLHPTGFVIAKLAEETYHPKQGRDDVALRKTMERLVQRLRRDLSVPHPILGDEISSNGERKVERFGDKLAEMLEWLTVLDDRRCTRDQALSAWDFVFDGGFAEY